MACLPSSLGQCMAWGDPHIVTFDGAKIDVYGVGEYVFTQFNKTHVDFEGTIITYFL